jgi:adenylosuccinate synthase
LYEEFPKEINVFEECEPVYEEMEGWSASTLGIRDFKELPKAAKVYIRRIERMLGVRVNVISTGQRRDELILLKKQF